LGQDSTRQWLAQRKIESFAEKLRSYRT